MAVLGWNSRRDWLFLGRGWRNQFLQFTPREPAVIGLAGIPESFWQRPPVHPVPALPPRMRWLNDGPVLNLERIPRLIFRDQHFVQLFSRPNPDRLDFTSRRNRLREIHEPHAGNLRNKNFSAVHLLNAAHHKPHALLQRQPEAGHPRIGQCNAPAKFLFLKNRNHTPPAPDHISVARATEPRLLGARIGVRLYEHFLGAQLRSAI